MKMPSKIPKKDSPTLERQDFNGLSVAIGRKS